MSEFVVDASVAAKWVLPSTQEPLISEASQLLDRYARTELLLLVPEIFWAEIGNILWKAVRRSRCTSDLALAGLRSLRNLDLPTFPNSPLLEKSLEIAIRYDRSVYDSLYVALAIESRATLLTADERLANTLAAYLPVKWLGAL